MLLVSLIFDFNKLLSFPSHRRDTNSLLKSPIRDTKSKVGIFSLVENQSTYPFLVLRIQTRHNPFEGTKEVCEQKITAWHRHVRWFSTNEKIPTLQGIRMKKRRNWCLLPRRGKGAKGYFFKGAKGYHDYYLSAYYKKLFCSKVMGMEGLEPSTLRLSGVYSEPLSYMPL